MTAATAVRPHFAQLRVGSVTELTVALRSAPVADFRALSELVDHADQLRPCAGATRRGCRLDAATGSDGPVGEAALVRATVTRRRVDADTGEVHQTVQVLSEAGAVVHAGQLDWTVPLTAEDADVRPGPVDDIGSVAWGRALTERLGADPDFTSAVSTFDGTIAIAAGSAEVHWRIYRGAILETSRRSLDGATFTITADELTWLQLLTGEHDEYVRFAARGRFRVLGNGFQYLRLTRAVRVLVDRARAMAAEAR